MSAVMPKGPWDHDIHTRRKGHPIAIIKRNGPSYVELAYVPPHGKYSESIALAAHALPDLIAELRKSMQALENIAAYLVKHQALLPPVSLTGTELQIQRNRAALAKAGQS